MGRASKLNHSISYANLPSVLPESQEMRPAVQIPDRDRTLSDPVRTCEAENLKWYC